MRKLKKYAYMNSQQTGNNHNKTQSKIHKLLSNDFLIFLLARKQHWLASHKRIRGKLSILKLVLNTNS